MYLVSSSSEPPMTIFCVNPGISCTLLECGYFTARETHTTVATLARREPTNTTLYDYLLLLVIPSVVRS